MSGAGEAGAGEPLALQVRVTLDDQVRMNEWLLDRPELLRTRLAGRALTLVLVPPLGLLLGAGAASMQGGEPFWPALRWAVTDRGTQGIMATVAGMLFALWGVLRLLRRPLLRRRLRRLLPERPGVDPADPALTEPARLVLDGEGFVSETAAATSRVPWAAVKELADAGTLLVLRTGRYSGYVIPKRDLSPADDAALRAAVTRARR